MKPDQISALQPWLQYVPIFATALLFVVIVWAITRVFRNRENELEWADLISIRTIDGKQKADWNQIGKGSGVLLAVALPFIYVYNPTVEPFGLAAVMAASLLYLGGVSAYAATLRARQGSVETIKTTEAAPVSRTTETRIETPPLEGATP